jgi:hypothetical protein
MFDNLHNATVSMPLTSSELVLVSGGRINEELVHSTEDGFVQLELYKITVVLAGVQQPVFC